MSARVNRGRALVPLLLVVVVALVLLLWPRGDRHVEGVTTVTFWHALGSDHQALLNELVAEFNAANPDVIVEAEYQGNYGALQQKLVAAVAAGAPPTLSLVYNNWSAAFLEGEALVPLEKFVSDPELGLSAEERADYIPAFVEANSWNGQWVTMPFNKSIYVLYYNRDLLDAAGVGVPATMDELRSAARAVTERTGVKGLALQATVDQFGIFLHAFGGSWLDEQGRVAFDNDAGVAALQFMQDLVLVDESAYYHDGYLDDEFNAGNTAMFFATVATIPWLSDERHNWGAAPVPAGTVQAAVVQGTDIALFKQASEEEQRAAWRFVKYLTSPEVNARWAVGSGYLPIRDSAAASSVYQEHVNSAPEKYKAGVDQLHHAKFDPGLAAWFDARTFITEAVEKALILGTSPQEALVEAADRTRAALGE